MIISVKKKMRDKQMFSVRDKVFLKGKKKERGKKVVVPEGIIHIRATANNTIFVIADRRGKVIDWISGGRIGLKGPARATPFAAERMTRWVAKQLRDLQWKVVKIWVGGFGQGRFAAIRWLSKRSVFRIVLVKDVSSVAFGGCRAKKRRRI